MNIGLSIFVPSHLSAPFLHNLVWSMSKLIRDWAEYRKARNKAVGLLKSAKRKYYVSQLENNQHNAK